AESGAAGDALADAFVALAGGKGHDGLIASGEIENAGAEGGVGDGVADDESGGGGKGVVGAPDDPAFGGAGGGGGSSVGGGAGVENGVAGVAVAGVVDVD